jgi:hypothetical protein
LVAVVALAAVFDVYHNASQDVGKHTKKASSSNESEASKVFFCSQVPGHNPKTPGNENPVRLRCSANQDKFLLKYYNQRTFQLMKAETAHSSVFAVRHFMSLPFKRVSFSSPDDTPPLL